MLLLLQSYVTFQQFPRGGGEIVTPIVESVDNDEDLLLIAWFIFMRQYDK
jgi:hypothetical protein